jgi:hypothetical protein
MQDVLPIDIAWLHAAAPRYFGLTDSAAPR